MSKKIWLKFWVRYNIWFFRFVLIILLIISLFVFGRFNRVTQIKQNESVLNITSLFSFKDQVPEEANFLISSSEDRAVLDSTLQTIFPYGSFYLSDEQKVIEVMRFVTTFLKHENNTGLATKILKDGYAICGGKAYVFRILVRKLGLPARYIGIHYTPGQGDMIW